MLRPYPFARAAWLTAPLTAVLVFAACEAPSPEAPDPAHVVRVATFNIEDVRPEDLETPDHPRLRATAEIVRALRPDVLLVNEIAYDAEAQSGQRFADVFLNTDTLRYRAFMAPSNTGERSGFDFDNDGTAAETYPDPPPAGADGSPGPQTPGGRLYGNDSFGFGTFPGQYAMALLVRDDLEILRDSVRTFRLFRWADMPEARLPVDPATGEPWYDEAERAAFRLSSKSHWDVPVRLPSGQVLHVLASHPTPPAFDGPEERNVRRNHDEIRLWADYLSGADYLVDDAGRRGGLPPGVPFVIVGDQNADPDEGSGRGAIGQLLDHPRVNGAYVPRADTAGQALYPDLDPDDTARWGLRVDYVLPSAGLEVLGGGVYRPDTTLTPLSDHFPVWVDLYLPPGAP